MMHVLMKKLWLPPGLKSTSYIIVPMSTESKKANGLLHWPFIHAAP
jgi:hypothetical protein